MSKTKALRRVVVETIHSVAPTLPVYHKRAPDNAPFPYGVYDLRRVDLNDLSRDDYTIELNLWDHASDSTRVDELADLIEEAFNAVNLPQEDILPTFYRVTRYPVEDADKDIQRVLVECQAQLYTITSQEEES